jgi:hypothetical protein
LRSLKKWLRFGAQGGYRHAMIIVTGADQPQSQALALRPDRVYRTGVITAPRMDPGAGIAETARRFTGLNGGPLGGFFATLVAKFKAWRARPMAFQFIQPARAAASPQIPATTGATASVIDSNGNSRVILGTYGVGPVPMAAQMISPEAYGQYQRLAQSAASQQPALVGGATFVDAMAYRNGLIWRRP